MRTTYPWADGIVAVSAGVAGVVKGITRLPTHRIRTIYNPAVTADFYSRADEKLHHPWFEPGEPPVILSVGKLAPEKDLPTLIRAFAILCKRNPARLMIIGDGEEEDHLRTLVQKLRINDRVRFEGFQQNPLKYMKRAALFALASKYEGFGLVLAEALACGTPVVATDCPYGPAEILENGEYGALVPVGNSEAMARAMEDALNRTYDREKLRARGNCFSLSNALDEYLDVMALRPSEVDCAVA
jgi:glycosyltransferase involved in cell wall biosynthesis